MPLAGRRVCPGGFPASNAGYAQTFSFGNRVFHHLIRSRGTPRDRRRRNRQPRNAVEDRREQVPRDRHLGQLEGHVLRVPRHLGSDFDQLFSQRSQRPVSHWFRQGQPTQEIAQVVGQREELQAGLVTYEFWRDGQLEFSTDIPIPT